MPNHWSTLQLTEYFSGISGTEDEGAALQQAVERATETLEAEVGAVVIDGRVRATWGLGHDQDGAELLPLTGPAREVVLPGLGTLHGSAASLRGSGDDVLVVARQDSPLQAEERQLLQAMAQLLGLVLRNVRTLAAERALREDKEREAAERLRLLEELRTRQRLLERLLAIQGAVSSRRPLPEVLDAVTAGAADLLDGVRVALLLTDSLADGGLTVASGSEPDVAADVGTTRTVLDAAAEAIAAGAVVETTTGSTRLVAVPVSVDGEVGGCLVAVPRAPEGDDRDADPHRGGRRALLTAFAQQASLALTDARTVEAVTLANHDPVTGLPTRALFLERLHDTLAEGGDHIVLFIDLDRFKAVNDSLGHRAGDELLAAVSHRIRACLRTDDTAARIGGDEFAVLLRDVPQEVGVGVAERLIESLRKPFRIASRNVVIGASVGLADSRTHLDGADDLLSNADVAMYVAKKRGASQVAVFEPRMHSETVERLDLLADLQRALSRGDLRLHYQPVVDLGSGHPVGAEGLLRWTDPRRGTVPPLAFIGLAEESGLIVDIGRWVLQEGVRQLARWREDLPALTLNLNVSARQLVDKDFIPHLEQILAAVALPPGTLTLELTETALMYDPDTSAHQIDRLKTLGVRLAVDDFGTGYSSLSYLRRFPVDQVKIDRAFIAQVNSGSEDLAVVRSVIELGSALRLQTVAEGIETEDQLDTLRRLGCAMGQGYHLSRPLDADGAWRYLSGHGAGSVPSPRSAPSDPQPAGRRAPDTTSA